MSEEEAKKIKADFSMDLGKNLIDIDGGNVYSNLWFCGIEPGGEFKEKAIKEYKDREDLKKDYTYSINGFVLPYLIEDFQKRGWNVDLNIGKIVAGWQDVNVNEKFDYNKKQHNVFKLNLFPLPAPKVVSWTNEHYDLTGCTLKSEYYGRCIENRFPNIRKLVYNFKPKAVVCIGREFVREFISAFWNLEGAIDYQKISSYMQKDVPILSKYYFPLKESIVTKNPQIHIYKNEEDSDSPIIINLPFFGQHLNSIDDIKSIGNYIREELKIPSNEKGID